MAERSRVMTEVERYWLETGLSAETLADMRNELEPHLIEAELEGRTVDDVTGDRAAFAEHWAEPRKGRAVQSWADVQSGRVRRRRETRWELTLYGTGATALVVAAGAVASQGRRGITRR